MIIGSGRARRHGQRRRSTLHDARAMDWGSQDTEGREINKIRRKNFIDAFVLDTRVLPSSHPMSLST
jgi:hypothetical protein